LAPADELSFEEHIKPLFGERDREAMDWAFDLWSHADVAENSAEILGRLREGSMPCDGAWPAQKVALFEHWIAAGRPT
jgi:hypothetical protein